MPKHISVHVYPILRHLLTKDVPKELIISSNSIRLLDAVGQGTLTHVTVAMLLGPTFDATILIA